jgi:hypothetical protein
VTPTEEPCACGGTVWDKEHHVELAAARALNAELLAALKECADFIRGCGEPVPDNAEAIIARAEKEGK